MLTAQDLVNAKLYSSEQEAIDDAFRHLLRARPELRIRLAVHRYETEDISLALAASLAGVSWPEMREILIERNVSVRLGPETVDEAREEVETLRSELAKRP